MCTYEMEQREATLSWILSFKGRQITAFFIWLEFVSTAFTLICITLFL